jgi:hypothetical protein
MPDTADRAPVPRVTAAAVAHLPWLEKAAVAGFVLATQAAVAPSILESCHLEACQLPP